jgi:hypothetical protein
MPVLRFLVGLLWPTYSAAWKNWVTFLAGTLATLAGATTVYLMRTEPAGSSRPVWALSALIFWAVILPAWFWFDYFCIWKTEPHPPGAPLDQFKHGQELSRNIWLAFVALLVGFYFK